VNRPRPDTCVPGRQIAGGIAERRAIGAEAGASGRSCDRGPAAEVPPASGETRPAAAEAAKMRATAPEAAHACTAEMSTTEMAATTEVATTTNMTAAAEMAAAPATSTASTAAAGRISRTAKRERKSNHGKEFEL
jgi:hypothetical protein